GETAALARRRAEHAAARLDLLAERVGLAAEALVVEPLDARRQHGDPVRAPRIGEEIPRLPAGELRLELRDALLQLALLRDELLDPGRGFLGRGAQQRAHLVEHALALVDQLERAAAGRGLH